jgi:hypothetical protein
VGCSACNATSASIHLPNNTRWRLACVTDLVGGSSPDAVGWFQRRAQKDACCTAWHLLVSTQLLHAPRTDQFPFVHLLNIQSKASMQKRSKNNAKRAPELPISRFFSSPCTRWLAKLRFRCAAGRLNGTWYPRSGLKRAKNSLLSADWS